MAGKNPRNKKKARKNVRGQNPRQLGPQEVLEQARERSARAKKEHHAGRPGFSSGRVAPLGADLQRAREKAQAKRWGHPIGQPQHEALFDQGKQAARGVRGTNVPGGVNQPTARNLERDVADANELRDPTVLDGHGKVINLDEFIQEMPYEKSGAGRVQPSQESPEQYFKKAYESEIGNGPLPERGSKTQRQAQRMATARTQAIFGPEVQIDYEKAIGGNIEIKKLDKTQDINDRKLWVYTTGTFPGSPDTPTNDGRSRPVSHTPTQFMEKITPSERAWLEAQFEMGPDNNTGNRFVGAKGRDGNSAAKRNFSRYTNLRQQGLSAKAALEHIQTDNRGRASYTNSKISDKERGLRQEADDNLEQRLNPRATGRSKKSQSLAPSHKDFKYSIEVPRISSPEEISKLHKDWSDADVARFREIERMKIQDHILSKNEAWSHETRADRLYKNPQFKDHNTELGHKRVVVFTTNLGGPNVSVPSESLAGQYVIKKRKKMLADNKDATRYELKGEFPNTVRDQHLVEAGTGLSLGFQGRYGVFHNTGWKNSKKSSKGYGKAMPVGAQVLRDHAGRPVYDSAGNLRYTEGYTRPVAVGTSKAAGFKVFLG